MILERLWSKDFWVKYKGEIHAVMCFAIHNKIPKNVMNWKN